ncbi:hypothetical protein IVB69_04790 [Flavobacterium sp. J49]|uniref:hypothetical protein n=1 Tax=Flavobacterium sp. J49 TaxID=2718534 RepID=UPI0015949EBD|nr:hypothetical protein [Flavobacterium sp. J49]MBF6640785.1 hypothetical protein [Flavobacterium sp. J49]NIC02032.1 hypothetical protein [Flavobacterium sp. J49]
MKKTLLLALGLLSISCVETKNEFKGLGALSIGTEFSSLPMASSFTKVMDDEFNINRFELSKEIGSVSDLNVTTENGKISEVKFSSNEATNTAELEEMFKTLREEKIDQSKLIGVEEGIAIKTYQTEDKTIFVSVIQYPNRLLKNGQPYSEYSYIHKDAAARNHQLTLKSMGKK